MELITSINAAETKSDVVAHSFNPIRQDAEASESLQGIGG